MTNILEIRPVMIDGKKQTPNFVCVTRDIGEKYTPLLGYDPWIRCKEDPITSFHAANTANIFMCPNFPKLKPDPPFSPGSPTSIYCPIVQKNLFVGQPNPLVQYQGYDLLHQLFHLYLQDASLTPSTSPPETQNWNACVGLPFVPLLSSPSSRNPYNFIYYIACEWSLFFRRPRAFCKALTLLLPVVNQDCTTTPDPFLPPFLRLNNLTLPLSLTPLMGLNSTNSTNLLVASS